jgi:serine/threonine-protein kinase Chk1
MHCECLHLYRHCINSHQSVRKAVPKGQASPIVAIKFMNKRHAQKHGGFTLNQFQKEAACHKALESHKNIIRYYNSAKSEFYVWIAMELAQGGDLFDKIEPEVGVSEQIAHIYFTQLISAVRWMHSKGIAHRDIKPENILLDVNGNLKLADFGLATIFEHRGQRRMCETAVGSPPYMACELIHEHGQRIEPYDPTLIDIWSCGVVLFVLLCGNTPWSEPTVRSEEFYEYKTSGGKGAEWDELWQNMGQMPRSLVYGMLKLNPKDRYKMNQVVLHPWFIQPNPLLAPSGEVADPIGLATQMMENLKVDLEAPPATPRRRRDDTSATVRGPLMPSRSEPGMEMEIDTIQMAPSTQPHFPSADALSRMGGSSNFGIPSATQPVAERPSLARWETGRIPAPARALLESEVTMSQFAAEPAVPVSRTQFARFFNDIVPAATAANFFSDAPLSLLSDSIAEAIHTLGGKAVKKDRRFGSNDYTLWMTCQDRRGQLLKGSVLFRQAHQGVSEVVFQKATGCPMEWREHFKQVAVRCKDMILTPDNI